MYVFRENGFPVSCKIPGHQTLALATVKKGKTISEKVASVRLGVILMLNRITGVLDFSHRPEF
jgi:hypothetical protein